MGCDEVLSVLSTVLVPNDAMFAETAACSRTGLTKLKINSTARLCRMHVLT